MENEPLERLTLTIPANIIRDAKHTAVDRNISVSAAVTKFLKAWSERPIDFIDSKDPDPTTYPIGGKPGDVIHEK